MRRQTDNSSKEKIHETKGKFSGYEKSSNQVPTGNSNDCACSCPIDETGVSTLAEGECLVIPQQQW